MSTIFFLKAILVSTNFTQLSIDIRQNSDSKGEQITNYFYFTWMSANSDENKEEKEEEDKKKSNR